MIIATWMLRLDSVAVILGGNVYMNGKYYTIELIFLFYLWFLELP